MADASIFFPSLTSPTKIGTIEVDILVEQEHKLESEVMEHPVEDGFPVADHVVRKPIRVSMVVGVTASPVTWLDKLGSESDKVDNAISAFEQIYKNAQPITIVTPTNIWKNMVMTSAAIPRSLENGNLIRIPCEFVQIRTVSVKTTDIPADIVASSVTNSAGTTEADGGTATQTDAGDVSSSTSSDSSSSSSSSGGKYTSVLKSAKTALGG